MSDYAQVQEQLNQALLYIGQLEAGIGQAAPYMVPINKDVPAVTGTGVVDSALNCTTGNWYGTPTEYHYAWKGGGGALGTDANSYTPVTADVGKQVSCTVTAVNGAGSTVAPPSNAVEVLPAGTQQAAMPEAAHAPAHAEPRAHAAPAANHTRAHR